MPESIKQQMTFGGGMNAQAPAHLIGADQVQTATNIDFTLWRGAALARRGYDNYITTTYTHTTLFKSYWGGNVSDWSIYSYHGGGVGRITNSNTTMGTYTQIMSAGVDQAGFGKYNNFVYVAAGPNYAKDNGTLTTDWIKQVPPKPTVTINTNTGIVITTGSMPVAEGSFVSVSTATNGTYTYSCDPTSGRVTLVNTANLNLATNGSFATDTIGVVYSSIGFSDPTNIYRISIDFAIDSVTLGTAVTTETVTNGTNTTTITLTNGTIATGFANYWHAEYLPNNGSSIDSALSIPNSLTGALQQYGSGGTGTAVSDDVVSTIQSLINTDQTTPITQITFNGNVLSNLGIPKTNFQLVGTSTGTADPWSAIKGVRMVFESYTTTQQALVGTSQMLGDEGYPLTDMNIGYIWYQTFAEFDSNGNFIGESAASPPAGPYKCQNANAALVTTNTLTGSPGITHIITYRQGGYVQAPYAVNTQSLGTLTMTDTVSDIQELLNDTPMVINVMSPGLFPSAISVMAPETWYARMFVAQSNLLYWSEAGRPDQFLLTNYAQISDAGDQVQGLSVWASGLVIINQNSVYEMNGSVFEGPNTNYVIQKSGARKGSIARQTIIKTPYGIPLVNYDGISMYQPGAGVELPLPWVTEQIGDMFRGFGGDSPAALNNSRVPGINGFIFQAAAAFNEGKLYIAVPTGTNTINDTIIVLDFTLQKCFIYQYQIVNKGSAPFYSLLWDFLNNNIYAGGVDGIYQIENFVTEPVQIAGTGTSPTTTAGAVPWSFLTKAWTAPTDSLVENLAVEFIGGPIQVSAIYDSTNTVTVGTIVSSNSKSYSILPLDAVVENNLVFGFQQVTAPSTSTSLPNFTFPTAVYGITWDSFPHPPKVQFFQTDYFNNSYQGDKLWDIFFCDLGFLQSNFNTGLYGTETITGSATVTGSPNAIGTVTAVTFVDGVSVMTNTIVGTGLPSQGRRIYDFSFPSETYGEVAYTIYQAGTTTATITSGTTTSTTTIQNVFKLWDHQFQCRNEPPKVTYWHTDWESMEENICDGWDTDINPNGTVYGTAFIDNVAISTATYTGSKRQSFTFNWPVESYGRTIYVEYNSAASNTFKHYKTWYHLRKEPDRWTSFVSERRSAEEQHFDSFECELNCLGHTVLATAFVDNVAVDTYTCTSTGSTARERFVFATPAETYGKTVYAQYNSSGVFKFFRDEFNGTKEPDRLNFVQKILPPYPSEHYAKTWIVEMNALGTAVHGTLFIEGNAITTATFGTSGNIGIREMYQIGIDNPTVVALQTATAIECRFGNITSTNLFKLYRTEIESDPKPFGKPTWSVSYKKIGGASQIDVARYWSIDVEVPQGGVSSTATVIWDIDQQTGFSTNTLTFTNTGRSYIDLIPFPFGGRGRIFQQRISFNDSFGNPMNAKVWRAIMMEERVGVKGFSTMAIVGTPNTNG